MCHQDKEEKAENTAGHQPQQIKDSCSGSQLSEQIIQDVYKRQELGIYEMRQDGLRQVNNPSELLLSQDHEGMSGVAIASAIEGIRCV